jgi:hypothetical protein
MPPGIASIRCLRGVGSFSRTKSNPAVLATFRNWILGDGAVGLSDNRRCPRARAAIAARRTPMIAGRKCMRIEIQAYTNSAVFTSTRSILSPDRLRPDRNMEGDHSAEGMHTLADEATRSVVAVTLIARSAGKPPARFTWCSRCRGAFPATQWMLAPADANRSFP